MMTEEIKPMADTVLTPCGHRKVALEMDCKAALGDLLLIFATLLRLPTKEVVRCLVDGTLVRDIRESVDECFICAMENGTNRRVNEYMNILENGFSKLVQAERGEYDQHGEQAKLSTLRHAYTSLFTHPERPLVAPYESLFLFWQQNPSATIKEAPPLFISPSALSAERIYKEVGLVRSTWVNESADHIATQLEFVSKLLYAQAAAKTDAGEQPRACEDDHLQPFTVVTKADELARLSEVLAEFFHYHISAWWSAFFNALAVRDVYPLYAGLGIIGAVIVSELAKEVSLSAGV